MLTRNRIYAAYSLLATLLVYLVIGCSSSPTGENTIPLAEKFAAGPSELPDTTVDGEVSTGVTFDDIAGTRVIVQSSVFDGDTLIINCRFVSSTARSVSRMVKIPTNLTGAVVTGPSGAVLCRYYYQFSSSEDSVSLIMETPGNRLTVTHDNTGLWESYDLSGETYVIRFADEVEYQHAVELMNEYQDGSLKSPLPEADEALLQQCLGVQEFLDRPSELSANDDLTTLLELVSNEHFISWMIRGDNVDQGLHWHCGVGCVCGASGIVATVSCPYFFLGWPALICAPALGISTACAIAGVAMGD